MIVCKKHMIVTDNTIVDLRKVCAIITTCSDIRTNVSWFIEFYLMGGRTVSIKDDYTEISRVFKFCMNYLTTSTINKETDNESLY